MFVATRGLSLVVASGGFSLVAGHGLLIAVDFLVAGYRFWGAWASGIVVAFLVAEHRL